MTGQTVRAIRLARYLDLLDDRTNRVIESTGDWEHVQILDARHNAAYTAWVDERYGARRPVVQAELELAVTR